MHQYLFTAVALCLFSAFIVFAHRILPRRGFSYALVGWGALLLFFGILGVVGRARLAVGGRVLSSTTRCVQPYNNRCVTTYELVTDSGERATYRAGPTDQALARDLPVGAQIYKQRWSLDYTVDGAAVHDFPWVPYFAFAGIGAAMVFCGGKRIWAGTPGGRLP
jgi:hypothetical protein